MKPTVFLCGGAGLVLFVLASACTTPKQDQRPSAHSANRATALAEYSMALREGLAGEDDAAVERFKSAIEADPDNIELHLELAILLLHGGRYADMDEQVDQALALNPDHIRALRLKSFGNRLRGQLDKALPPLERAIELEPDVLSHYVEAATIHQRLGDTTSAIQLLETATTTSTNRLEASQHLARLITEIAAHDRRDGHTPSPEYLDRVTAAVSGFPDDPVLLALYGDLLALHQRLDEAIEVFARIEALNPSDPQLRQKLALSLLAVGDSGRAIELLEEAVERQPDNFRLHLYLAELHQREKNPDAAIAHYRSAMELRPDVEEIYLQLASMLITRERQDEAREIIRLTRERWPADHRAVELEAFLLLQSRDYAQSAALFREAESMFTTHTGRPILARFYVNAAIANQMSTNQTESVRLLRTGMQQNPEVIRQYMALALQAQSGSFRLSSSIDVLESAPDLLPRDSASSTLLGLLNLRAEKYPAAIAHLEDSERLAIEAGDEEELNEQFYFWLGSACERNKDYDRAAEYFLQAINLQPDYADAHNYLAYMNAERGVMLEEAYDHVGVALAVEPDNPAFIDTRGWIYFKQGKFEEALADIQRAVDLLPDDETITEHLGDIHLALGNEEEAVVWWKKSYALSQTNDAVKQKLIDRGIDLSIIAPVAPEAEPGDTAIEAPVMTEEE